ncbi:hypothetical protein TRFO_27779 [Tritrichomonas foetus]|uniref:Atg6 BARA domain-containing protein n=1 Tax=Tritrichomonas foetus TaxID=1144522 RepID=A0A1J4K108_9EUKA|nr:hypothetical protein TRFO_27779 [Tritrichomonas foetus]|eukprot:OHT04642.1 hypothetical protein TRFO_27779 [Tritrichomonas foetus]
MADVGESPFERDPYILFVCRKCGALCLTFPEYLFNEEEDFSIVHPFESPDNNIPDILTYSSSASHQQSSTSLEYFKKLQDKDFSFPVCNICSMEIIQKISSQIKFLNTAESFYSRLDIKDKSIFQETLEQEIEELNQELVSVQNNLNSSSDSPNQENNVNLDDTKNNHDLPIDKRKRRPSKLPRSGLFKSIMLSVTFHIHFYRHYVTINSMKIGQNEHHTIKDEEINIGLLLLGHLIKCLADIVQIDSSPIVIGANICMKLANGKVIPLNATDMKKRKTVLQFNLALDVLFSVAARIFESPMIKSDSMMPPYLISVSDHTISNESYLFNDRNPNAWIHPMKLLLTNFKFMLAYGIRNSVLSFR